MTTGTPSTQTLHDAARRADEKPIDDLMAFLRAVQDGDTPTARRLLHDYPPFRDASYGEGITVAHVAAMRAHLDVLTALIDAGADIQAVTNAGTTVPDAGAQSGDRRVLERLAPFIDVDLDTFDLEQAERGDGKDGATGR